MERLSRIWLKRELGCSVVLMFSGSVSVVVSNVVVIVRSSEWLSRCVIFVVIGRLEMSEVLRFRCMRVMS